MIKSVLNHRIYPFILVILVICSLNLFIEELTEYGLYGTQVLFWVSLFNIIFIFFIIKSKKSSFRPKSFKDQFIRFMIVGIANICLYTSFEYISAASYTTLNRIDIPIIILITAFTIKQSKKNISLSIITIAFVFFILYNSQKVDEKLIGYILVIIGVIGKVINTLIKKRMSTNESLEIIILVGSISGLIWSFIWMYFNSIPLFDFKNNMSIAILFISLLNLSLNYLLLFLFQRFSAQTVRFPFLIAALLIMILEMIIEKKFFSWILILTNLILLSLISLIVLNKEKKQSIKQ